MDWKDRIAELRAEWTGRKVIYQGEQHTVVDVEGERRVKAVTIVRGDDRLQPIPGTEVRYPCDTLLLSVGLLPENELSRQAGVRINPVTRGAFVNDQLMTSVPGVFACGNVLHVHDLVDYVSEEADRAGKNAAKFIKGELSESSSNEIEIVATEGARYTVPSTIDVDRMDDKLTVRFRVGAVFKDSYVSVYFDDERVMHNKKRIMAPGEMEQVILLKDKLAEKPGLKKITVKIENE